MVKTSSFTIDTKKYFPLRGPSMIEISEMHLFETEYYGKKSLKSHFAKKKFFSKFSNLKSFFFLEKGGWPISYYN